jgi:integrase/recombinase XerD
MRCFRRHCLRACVSGWWKSARAQGKMLDGGWLFPGQNPVDPLSTRQLNRAIRAAAGAARISKRVSMHMLRHYLPFLTMFGTA